MGYFEPEDDATKAQKNFFRYSKRTLARFSQELLFFYNPAEWNSMLSQGVFPSLGLFDEVTRFFDHFMRETTGMDGTMYATLKKGSTPSKVRKQAQPVKYLMKMFPLTKGAVNWFAVFSDDFAREFDVTIPSQNRR